eukprot:TRINITY_DN34462_c0_g1_i1.p1 TRINITY_DN34462_c0_g1~~TRINITY_DN34462_c0_g1_i1.p1  ORF type:complete len:280 (+),score=45.97 TRINITY_DN34462_c0_g1_i1:337-1176(+)
MGSSQSAAWTEIAPGFWNLRGKFSIAVVQIGTQMSLIRLSNGRFLVIDAVDMNDDQKAQFDELTSSGSLIEAVLATHPFHTLALPSFYAAYPKATYYGCPRHLRQLKDIPWAGSFEDCGVLNRWAPDVALSIPRGCEFRDPRPATSNHFICVWVLAVAARTIHVDDSVMAFEDPGLILRLLGTKAGKFGFHPSLRNGNALLPGPAAVAELRKWFQEICDTWDFDTAVLAHDSVVRGSAKARLQTLLGAPETDAMWTSLARSDRRPVEAESTSVRGEECG